MKACSSIGDIGRGFQLHTDYILGGFDSDSFVGNSLVDMYATCGFFAEARKVLDDLPLISIIWNALLAGYCEGELFEEVLVCAEQHRTWHTCPVEQHSVVLQQPLPLDLFALVSCSNHGICFRDAYEGQCIWKDVLTLHLFKAVQCLLFVTLCISCNQCISRDDIPKSQPIEHLSRPWNITTLGIHVH